MSWPACGEIDIMEHAGREPSVETMFPQDVVVDYVRVYSRP